MDSGMKHSAMSIRCKRLLVSVLTTFTLSGMTGAEPAHQTELLSFESKSVEVTLEVGKQTADITFQFRNASQATVEIASLQAACSCIEAKLKDGLKIYKPGEKGEITAQFSVGNLIGTIEKQVLVKLAGASKDTLPIILKTNITIPELIEITPRTLIWKAGAAPTRQIQRIRVMGKEPIHITSVVTTDKQFVSELKTIREGWEYEIAVTPQETSEASFAIIKISSDSKISRYRSVNAFAMIKG
jgi:hypothetical protein